MHFFSHKLSQFSLHLLSKPGTRCHGNSHASAKQKQLKNYKQTKGEKKTFFYQPSEPRSIYNVNHALPMVHHHCNLFANRSNRILPFEEFNSLGILSSEGIAQSCGIFWNDTFHRSPPLVALLQQMLEEKNNHPPLKKSPYLTFSCEVLASLQSHI